MLSTGWNQCSGEVIVVDGKRCGADLLFAATAEVSAVDAALTERGFIRANEWVALDETSRIWRTDVYRSPVC